MPTQADLIFAKIVVLNNLASEDQIRECLGVLEKSEAMGKGKSLSSILIERGFLNQDQLKKIKSAQELHFKRKEDMQYGKIAIQQGLVTQQQVKECLNIQRQRQYKERLFQVLVSKKYLTAEEHKKVASLLARAQQAEKNSRPSSKISLKSTPPPNQSSPSSPPQESNQNQNPASAVKEAVGGDEFGELVVKQNLATVEQVKECLEIKDKLKAMGIDKDLAAVMLDKHYLSQSQVNQLKKTLVNQDGQKSPSPSNRQSRQQPAKKSTPPPSQSGQAKKSGKKSPIEGYDIECKLGQGAMGVIYKARHLKLQRVVALKVLLPEFANDKEFIQRFFREAKAAITLHHPNIIQGYHVGESNNFYYFAMEFVDGTTVKKMIEERGVMSEEDAINIVTQICNALEHAQENGIVHRDIKPDNIMMTKDRSAKLCDLGIAKEINQDGSLTQTGIALGTPYYISPEQAMGEKKIDIRSDIYSLGATFYHMITGQVPYEGDTSAVIMTKHISEDPPDPREVNPTLSAGTAEVIVKMMAKDRAYRYQTPSEVVDDLKAVKDQEIPKFGSGSSVFIQDGLKIPKKSVTRMSQIKSAPRLSQKLRKSSVLKKSKHPSGKGPQVSPRSSMVSKSYQKKSNPLPVLIALGVAMIVIIGVLIAILVTM